MSDYHINVFYSDEDAAYVADIPDLEACSALGASPEEALAEVERAKQAWLSAAREAGKPIPEPRYRPADLRALASRWCQRRRLRAHLQNLDPIPVGSWTQANTYWLASS